MKYLRPQEFDPYFCRYRVSFIRVVKYFAILFERRAQSMRLRAMQLPLIEFDDRTFWLNDLRILRTIGRRHRRNMPRVYDF